MPGPRGNARAPGADRAEGLCGGFRPVAVGQGVWVACSKADVEHVSVWTSGLDPERALRN